MKTVAIFAVLALGLTAQAQSPETAAAREQMELSQAMSDASNSAVDIIRELEHYLAKYPDTKQRMLIEQTLLKAAIETNDGPRIILYGEKAMANPTNDLQLVDRVISELVRKGDADSGKKAREYLTRYQSALLAMQRQTPPQHLTPGQWSEQLDRTMARSLALEAHARENVGDLEGALQTARKSWATFPSAEAARRTASVLTKMNREPEALQSLADAFTLEDPASTEADRAKDRATLGSLYAKANGSEKGLGDLILAAYDRTSSQMKAWMEALKVKDPNARANEIFDFTLPPINGGAPLVLSSLKGKTVVMDFWATWCVPCRAQHPVLENVKKRFADAGDVVFLAIDADDEPSLAAPFLAEQGWNDPTWFEAGLERKLTITSIPTVLVLDRSGHVSSRIGGFNPDRFEQLLSERITEALTSAAEK
jgi:thiol-disulfide isomerase/thioredoxin